MFDSHVVDSLKGHREEVISLDCIDIQNTKILVSGCDDGSIFLWDFTRTNQPIGQTSCPGSVSALQSWSRGIFCAWDETISNIDTRLLPSSVCDADMLLECPGIEEINDLSYYESLLCVAGDSGEIVLVDVDKGGIFSPSSTRMVHSNIASACIFDPKKRGSIYSGGLDSRVIHWNVEIDFENNTYTHILEDDFTMHSVKRECTFNPPFVYSMALSESGETIVCGMGDSIGVLIEDDDDFIQLDFQGHTSVVSDLTFSYWDAEYTFISVSADKSLFIWDLQLHNPESPKYSIKNSAKINCCLSEENNKLIIGDQSRNISIFTLR